jgi:uridine kinase
MAEISYEHDDQVPSSQRREGPSSEVLEVVAGVLARWRRASGGVSLVAVDGHGASGKTTIAEHLRAMTGASLVHTDDFYVPVERGSGRRGIWSHYDVSRLRAEALEPLRVGREAVFQSFDWGSGAVAGDLTHVAPSELVIVEGVYSAALELADLVDKAIYVDTPEPERLARLEARVAPEDWDAEWLAAEKEYFATTRPMDSFDLVIRGSATGPPVPRDARAPCGGRRAGTFS